MTQEQTERERIQELAAGLGRDILDRADHRRAESVGVVYRDGDTLRVTQLYSSGHVDQAPLGDAIRAAGGASNVVAVVHNHPYAIGETGNAEPNDTRKANMLPSANDWNRSAREFGQRDVPLFIVGPDDRLRRYESADREQWLGELEVPRVGNRRFDPDSGPTVRMPDHAPPRAEGPGPEVAHAQTRQLYDQALSTQIPPLCERPDQDRQQAAGYATYLATERGFSDITGVGLNRAGGELLCIAGRSGNPDPHANAIAVPAAEAAGASPDEWLRRADASRSDQARESVQSKEPALAQETAQSQDAVAIAARR